METTVKTELLKYEILNILEEIFDAHQNRVLDGKTSLLDTLQTVSADTASIPVGGKCAVLAAQVAHTAFYLDQAKIYIQKGRHEEADWYSIWQNVNGVSTEEWITYQNNLRKSYNEIVDLINHTSNWNDQVTINGLLAIIAHSAYHLGEIRQTLCVLT